MGRGLTIALALGVGLLAGIPLGGRLMAPAPAPVPAAAPVVTGFAAVPDAIGAQDVSGPYDAADWPKNLSTLPGHEKWTWGAAQGIFAESPNRVYLLGRGELPNLPEPATTKLPQLGPSIQFPVGGLPWRSATATALPGAGGTGGDPEKGMEIWRGSKPPYRELGVDARSEEHTSELQSQSNLVCR